jgi:hypothetical protein
MAQNNVSVKPIGSFASGNSHLPRQLLLLSLKQWKDICEKFQLEESTSSKSWTGRTSSKAGLPLTASKGFASFQ